MIEISAANTYHKRTMINSKKTFNTLAALQLGISLLLGSLMVIGCSGKSDADVAQPKSGVYNSGHMAGDDVSAARKPKMPKAP